MASTAPEAIDGPGHRGLAARTAGRKPSDAGKPSIDRAGVASLVVQEDVEAQVRRYLVRTFGCQMNEHDSERIAGLLEADGLVAAADVSDADVVVLNTCCIRENADNKLYGNLGHLKTWKHERPGRQIVVSGCLAQKDRELVQAKAGHVDVVMGTHNVHRAADLLRDSRRGGPVTEILDAAV